MEMFYIRLGKLSFRQIWLCREVSKSLTAVLVVGLVGLGMVFGGVIGWYCCEVRLRETFLTVDDLERLY